MTRQNTCQSTVNVMNREDDACGKREERRLNSTAARHGNRRQRTRRSKRRSVLRLRRERRVARAAFGVEPGAGSPQVWAHKHIIGMGRTTWHTVSCWTPRRRRARMDDCTHTHAPGPVFVHKPPNGAGVVGDAELPQLQARDDAVVQLRVSFIVLRVGVEIVPHLRVQT